MKAYDLYSGTYVNLPEPQAEAPRADSVDDMLEHDRLLTEKGYDAVAAIVEGTGDDPRARYFDMLSAYHMETATELRERFLTVNPAIEAWSKYIMEKMDKRLTEMALYRSSPLFIGLDLGEELRAPDYLWSSGEWVVKLPAGPPTLRERERAHIKTLNGGDQPWKRKQK